MRKPTCRICRAPLRPDGTCPFKCDPALARPGKRAIKSKPKSERPSPGCFNDQLSAVLNRIDLDFHRNSQAQIARRRK